MGVLLTYRSRLSLVLCLLCCVAASSQQLPSGNDALSKEQIKLFLQTAKVVNSKESSKGVTHPYRLTLSDGTITHDASFQTENERKQMMELGNGRVEMNFVDSYKYNIAAYRLAELIGFDDMMPVYVERQWEGKKGSLSWWLPVKMDEADRVTKKIEIPVEARDTWNQQMYKIRVFDQLVYDTDSNLTNVLIGENWKIWRIDFSRAFRLSKEPKDYKELEHCDKRLLEKLRSLKTEELAEQNKPYLTKDEIKAVMARRDKIVEHFDKLVAEKGEAAVLY